MKKQAEIGIIGGSGFYQLLKKAEEIKVETPYGSPSGKLALGKIFGQRIVFLPRHGSGHSFPPHKIPYKANLWALKSLGVKQVITCTACGSLQKEIRRGDFVVLDQFIDRTRQRQDTFYDGPITTHISTAYPYCPYLTKMASQIGKKQGLPIHPKGTVVVIEGPRFSTAAESIWFTKMGWEVVNMTQYPEVALARELEMCYLAIAVVTDWDVGVVATEKLKPVEFEEVVRVCGQNIKKAQKLILQIIKELPRTRRCLCQKALKGTRIE
jgi:5'-methylthioadenosine phosphorylase